MKKYFFALLLFIIAILSIHNVYAVSYSGWAYDKTHPVQAFVYDCGNGNCNVSLNADASSIDSSNYLYYQGTRTNMTANGAGILWSYVLNNPLKSGYLYSVSTYICHNSNAILVNKNSYAGQGLSSMTDLTGTVTNYFQGAFSNLDTMPFDTSSIGYLKCGVVYSIISPRQNSNYYGVNFTVDSYSSSYSSALVGYEIQSLGIASNLTSSDIQSIINNSGLASASDISQVNSALTSIETSINMNINDAEQNIITSQEQTRDAIINNQNENTDKEIESQTVCNSYDKNSIIQDESYLSINGGIGYDRLLGVTDFINIYKSKVTINLSYNVSSVYTCFYDINKTLISCSRNSSFSDNQVLELPSNYYFMKFTVIKTTNRPQISVCKNGNQALDDSINDVNDTLNNSDSSGATDDAGSFFSGFTTNTFGLTSIITSPLNLINSLTSKTCEPLHLTIPFVNKPLDLPCMTTIYQQHFGSFLTIYQTITFGVISYWVCIRIFALVKDFKNPDHDEIEVMDL